MKVALIQMEVSWEDPKANHVRAAKHLGHAAQAGSRLAILPEMFATGFSLSPVRIAEEPGGITEHWLVAAARAHGLHLLAGVAQWSEAERPENRALLVSPEGDVVRYAKIHPFSFSREDEHYGAGARVVTCDVEGVKVTPLVCYDLRFPEPFRLAADETDLYCVIANWPERRRMHWQTLLRARAIENLAYVAGVNRVGDGDDLHYAGDSALHSPWGETLASAAEDECVLIGEVDPAKVAEARAKFPVLKDRRPESYRR
jgi:predicted amidohydrolase